MVKGSVKASRSSGISLVLECKNEELSDVQMSYRRKQLEDIYLLQGALQGNAQIDIPVGLTGALVNGGSGPFRNMSNVSNDNSTGTNATNQFVGFMPRNGNIIGKAVSSGQRKMATTNGPTIQDATSMTIASTQSQSQSQTQSQPQPPQSITQALRATRKTTGSLPPPKFNIIEAEKEPEIEVLQEMRNNVPVSRTNAMNNLNPQLVGSQPKQVVPKTGPSRMMNKGSPAATPAPKPNNLLLLNINVRPRNLAAVAVNSMKRKDLDSKVKVVLMKSPSEFVEWLLRQGLIRSQQLCSTHKTLSRQPTKLKLGMFSDPKVLTSSGGYVWIGECCGRKYISVYSGSIFGSTPIDKVPPTSVLKLIYHWSCQTTISNVETWVKVDRAFVSKIYNYLKCVCSVILHDKIYDFGYEGTPVELGIVSLGTTTADGSRKAVKVEILGLYDRKNKSYRLFASTPEPASNSRERFLRILRPVKEVVHRNARIICDQSVDPTCLHSMGYSEVEVCYSSENENDPKTNSIIMFYLRKHVPKMFQAALSQLTEHQVQLTLDELCWREKFAATSADCYDNIMENISYITYRELENPGVLPLLEFVSEFPHNNFRYKSQIPSKTTPIVPASVILAPTNAPLNVVPTQYVENKCLVMTNKVMTKNGADFKPGDVDHSGAMGIKSLTSISPSSFRQQQPFTPIDLSAAANKDGKTQATSPLQSGEYKDLEPYFYGRIEGDPSFGQEFNIYVFKCHLCSDTFEDNIMFYSHMKYHYEGKLVEKDKLDLICPYCTSAFTSVNGLNKHKIDVHLMSDLTQVWCRICSEKFQNETLLKTHMMRKHVEAELPYRCEVCHFATSFYFEIINHFNRSHKGTPYIQCHFCLSVKTLTPNGAASFSTRLFQHMQKHSQKINCRSCVLVFYSKYLLNEHKKEHLSCANVRGVTRYESPNGYRILQFKPNIRSMPTNPTPQAMSLQSKNQAALSITQAEQSNLKFDLPGDQEEGFSYHCIECDFPLDAKQHFYQYRRCSKCSYHTCCQNMILKHSQVFHPPNAKKPLPYFIGSPIIMDSPLHCLCGFSTRSGHHMAKHLVICKKKSAYPDNDGTQKAEEEESACPQNQNEGQENTSNHSSPAPQAETELEQEQEPEPEAASEPQREPEREGEQMEIDDEDLPVLPLSVEIQEE